MTYRSQVTDHRALLAVLLLSGCASFDAPSTWIDGPSDWKPSFVLINIKDDVTSDCADAPIPAGRSLGGCTRYFGSGSTSFATSYVKRASRMEMLCFATHEVRHGLLRDEHGFGDSSCGTEGLQR